MLEKDIEAKSREMARKAGCLLLKFTSPGTAGVPDRVLIGPDGVRFVEFKRPGGKLTALQRAVIRKIEKAGGICHVCDNVSAFAEILATVSGDRD